MIARLKSFGSAMTSLSRPTGRGRQERRAVGGGGYRNETMRLVEGEPARAALDGALATVADLRPLPDGPDKPGPAVPDADDGPDGPSGPARAVRG